MLARNFSRAAVRRLPRARGARSYSDNHVFNGNPSKDWLEKKAAIEHHAGETTELWRKLSFYVAFPVTLLTVAWVRNVENAHAEHEAHVKAEHGGELPPTPDFEYMNKRAKSFPWGMNSLFYNSHVNKDMEEES